jgi:hypothetical protein
MHLGSARKLTQKTKQISNMDHTNIRGWTQVLVKGKQFRIRLIPCYSYKTYSPRIVFSDKEK